MLCSQTRNAGTAISTGAGWLSLTNITASDNAWTTYTWPNGTGSSSSAADETIKIRKADASYGSSNKSAGALWNDTTDTSASFGGATDKWSETWTPADINDTDFGLIIRATAGAFGTLSPYLECSNFGFTIPTGATIVGITATVERNKLPVATRANTVTGRVDTVTITVFYTTQYPRIMVY